MNNTAASASSSPALSSSAASKLAAAISEDQNQSNLNKQLQTLLDSYQPAAQHIIDVVLPAKISSLTTLYTHYASLPLPSPPIFTAIGCQPNTDILTLLSILTTELTDLLAHLDPIKVWITLNIPRMQDQKGITVTVKEDLVDILTQGRSSAISVLDGISRYHTSRGKMISQALKFPLCSSWQECVHQLDRKEWRLCVTMLMDLRNNYAIIYDMIQKNMKNLNKVNLNTYEHMY